MSRWSVPRRSARDRWPTAPAPTVPPAGPPQFDCPRCGHPERLHPRPGQTDLRACAACVAEGDLDQRDEQDICVLRRPAT